MTELSRAKRIGLWAPFAILLALGMGLLSSFYVLAFVRIVLEWGTRSYPDWQELSFWMTVGLSVWLGLPWFFIIRPGAKKLIFGLPEAEEDEKPPSGTGSLVLDSLLVSSGISWLIAISSPFFVSLSIMQSIAYGPEQNVPETLWEVIGYTLAWLVTSVVFAAALWLLGWLIRRFVRWRVGLRPPSATPPLEAD